MSTSIRTQAGSDHVTDTSGRRRFGAQAALLALPLGAALLAACGDDSSAMMTPDPMTQPTLEPPPAGQGMQYKMISTLAAGQEIERCQFIVAPPEGLNVNHDEVQYTPGSHHVLLYLTNYKSVPQMDMRGQMHDTSSVFDCAQGATADWTVTGVIAGAQSSGGGSMVKLPPDVAVQVPGGAVILMNTHYLNASTKPITAEARVNVYTIPKEQMKQAGGVLFFYNPIISIPAGGTSTAHMRCAVSTDITLTNIQSHMHRRGVGYGAYLYDKAGQGPQTLYTNTDWENVPVKEFSPGMNIAAGSALDYHCDYKNTEAHDILQGPSTKDEMCMLIGSYYPRNIELEGCTQATWYGNGNKSCNIAFSCAVGALGSQNFQDLIQCVADSCESVGQQLTDAIFCVFQASGSTCKDKCSGPAGGSDCQSCIATACQAKTDACKAATCS